MLQLSREAADFVRDVRDTDFGADALLRVAPGSTTDRANLRLAFVPAASVGDEVGESEGVSICVAPQLANELTDKLLDVAETPGGRGLVLRSA